MSAAHAPCHSEPAGEESRLFGNDCTRRRDASFLSMTRVLCRGTPGSHAVVLKPLHSALVRTDASGLRWRSGKSSVPRPGPVGAAIVPFAMSGRVVTSSRYQPL